MLNSPLVVLDFETTGLSPAMGARITEVAALRVINGKVVDKLVTLVNCGVRIPREITQITGITQAMVNAAPQAREVVPALIDFIGNDALAAHNASFDQKFLLAESQHLGLTPRHSQLVCSLLLSRRVLPQMHSHKLGELAKALNIHFNGNAHRAEADAEVTVALITHLLKTLRQQHGCQQIDTELLVQINKQVAAKVAQFLKTRASNTNH
ncbi:PolC-type DNA polymerase III [Deefgea sp. CFH1-16]|uniref:3'-5' exonuclease n=1 Tax=Deefgea sp. CFH1-16 TaxID=2675457 RepID=UPI0015F660F7|nr:3'-5' exonuclease [Deefgea sp. CFH1-16]MBM5573229.1 3'-5' exonuclease [Deefgea sp. CFH1-16]